MRSRIGNSSTRIGGLTTDQGQLEVALLASYPPEQIGRGCLAVSASASFDADTPITAAQGDIEWRDENGDGLRDVVALFSVASLRGHGAAR